MSHPIVFLGPSLPHEAAQALLPDAVIHPPAACGDLVKVMRLQPSYIVLIDGYFEQTAAVWHKEILFALSHGIPVYGASSMGALRAAEMTDFGMIGHGTIFEDYHSGVLDGDDEVALCHDDQYHSQQTPLVNIRATVAHAIHSGALSVSDGQAVIAHAKAQPFFERQLSHYPDPTIVDILQAHAIDQKALDAQNVLKHLAQHPPTKPQTNMIPSLFFNKIFIQKAYEAFSPSTPNLPPHEAGLSRATDPHQPCCQAALQLAHFYRDCLLAAQGSAPSDIDSLSDLALQASSDDHRQTMLRHMIIDWQQEPTHPELIGILGNYVSNFLAGIQVHLRQNNIGLAPAAVQTYATIYRRRHSLLSVERTENWLSEYALTNPQDFTAFIETMLLKHLLIEKGNINLFGIPTTLSWVQWHDSRLAQLLDQG